MKTILVPIDFSATSHNSAHYAAGMANWLHAEKLVLFNAYSIPMATELSWAALQAEELKQMSEDGLKRFKAEILPLCDASLVVECRSEFGFLTESIETVATEMGADLIVMGITGGGKLEEALIGSNTLHMVHHTHLPVIIVPPEAEWKPVTTIGWACDYQDIMKTTPVEVIKKLIALFGAKLVVVHNNPDPRAFDAEALAGNMQVYSLFLDLEPSFVAVSNHHFSEAMNDFTEKNHVDLLLAVPKKLSCIVSLFHRSNTKMLAFHSHVPLICVQGLKG